MQHFHIDVKISTGENERLTLNDDLCENDFYLLKSNDKKKYIKEENGWVWKNDSLYVDDEREERKSSHWNHTSTLWLMFSKASCEYIVLKRVAPSLIALFVDSVDEHKEKTPNADNNTQCAFSISWKIVKVFSASMKKQQNAFNVKNRKIVPVIKTEYKKEWEFY